MNQSCCENEKRDGYGCSGAAIYFLFYMILKRTISTFSIEKMSVSDFLFMKGTNFAISSCQINLMYKDINDGSLSILDFLT